MAAVDLTTTANVKDYLGINVAAQDDLIARLITTASEWLERFCGRSFHEAERTETYDGTGTTELYLTNWPVDSIDTLSVSEIEHDGEDYKLYPDIGKVYLSSGFGTGRRTVEVTYTAGYATIPGDLEQLCIEMVAEMLGQTQTNHALRREVLDGASYERLTTEQMEGVWRRRARRWRRAVVA